MVQTPARSARRTRRASERLNRKKGAKADKRGRAVPPTLVAYRRVVDSEGPDALASALIARHHCRLERLEELAHVVQAVALPTLTGFFGLDAAIYRLEPRTSRLPADAGRVWLDLLSWGLDSVVAATRLLMCIQIVGASVIARTQLERWSTNLGDNIGAEQEAGEDTAAWMDRIWHTPSAQNISHVRQSDSLEQAVITVLARRIDAGSCFKAMSELLHGRGPLIELVWWESVEFDGPLTSTHVQCTDVVTDALTLCVHRIQQGLSTALWQSGLRDHAKDTASTPIIAPSSSELHPLLPYVRSVEMPLVRDSRTFVDIVAAGADYDDGLRKFVSGRTPRFSPELAPALAFTERRARAYMLEHAAFARDQEQFGVLDDARLMKTSINTIFAAEMSALLARWLRDHGTLPAATSFAMASSALRSASWLWLEDDERSMGCLRVTIEHVARLRTLRTKPDTAAKLDARTATTPRDWIEACGWRRLRVLLRALGEYAHGADLVGLDGAAEVLVALNPHPDRAIAQLSGRTNTLTDLIALLDSECAAWLSTLDPTLGEAFWNLTGLDQERFDRGIEVRLDRAWRERSRNPRAPAT